MARDESAGAVGRRAVESGDARVAPGEGDAGTELEAGIELDAGIAPDRLALDQEVSVTATGDLTLHGVTKSVQVPLKAKWTGPTITVAGSTPIAFADYKMSPIEISILKTDDNGVLELQLAFVPA